MIRPARFAASAALLLMMIAFVVPYVFLDEIRSWTGSFLFWILISLASILLNVWITSKWRDRE